MSRMLSLPYLLLALFTASVVAEEPLPLFSADGYRQTHYRSPTPERIEGARTVTTAELQTLLASEPRPVLIDVYRRQYLFGRFIADEAHHNLPGSLWLANTGDGTLSVPWRDYFAAQLHRASHGHRDWPLVFYCRSDCWLGWNATRRAQALGYTRLYWYRDGTDAWQQAGLPLEPAEPVALP